MANDDPQQAGNEPNSLDSFPVLTAEPRTMSPPPQNHLADQIADLPQTLPQSLPEQGETQHREYAPEESEGWETEPEEEEEPTDKLFRDMQTANKLHALNPYKQALTLSDVDSCCVLENSAFPPDQTCSREKFIYRISKTSPLCIGLFTSVPSPDHPLASLPTYATAPLAESSSPRRATLLAHIVVTLTHNRTVGDEDMGLPADWQDPQPHLTPNIGHKPAGKTVALHSLAVLPEMQGRHVGSTLLKGFIQMVRDSKVAERISLITYRRLVGWYERFGFVSLGRSAATFGGEEWWDLVLEFGDDDTSSEMSA